MTAVHVLGRVDEVQQSRFVQVFWHGKLQKYAADFGVVVELLYLRRHFLKRRVRGHFGKRGRYADLRAAVNLVADVNFARGIVADQDYRKPYPAEFLLRKLPDLSSDVFARESCNEFSVYYLHILSPICCPCKRCFSE